MEMVSYWKKSESARSMLTKAPDGSLIMPIEGEKYPIPTIPRGHILFGALSKVKHEIKNQIYNDSWWALEEGKDRKEIVLEAKRKFHENIVPLFEETLRFDVLPPERMCPAVREIHRAWTVAKGSPELRDILCTILHEDDSYRNRFQWLENYIHVRFWTRNILKDFDKALAMLEHAEVVDDMKERIRLVRRITMLLLEDKSNREFFLRFCKELDWGKVKLSKGDKYHFRGKYFKVDYPYLEY